MRIVEGEKERIQVIEVVVIKMRGGGSRKTLTVRKISFGIGVERIFPFHSPRVEKIEIVRRAKVRQAKLYYLRELRGKAARLKELKTPRPTTKVKRSRPAAKKPKPQRLQPRKLDSLARKTIELKVSSLIWGERVRPLVITIGFWIAEDR